MISALLRLALSHSGACRRLASANDLEQTILSESALISALRAARLTRSEITRMVEPLAHLPPPTSAEIANAVETVCLRAKFG